MHSRVRNKGLSLHINAKEVKFLRLAATMQLLAIALASKAGSLVTA
jgi:hypothetical protein